MRLTLRTLLAWLDHVLPPEEQHELDGKVAASVAAQHLVERIRRVVERPTIPAPRIEGRGLAADANSVAEYLDNSLDHDRLEAFERICIDSDMHLAEVAACHGLLAALAQDPHACAPLDAAGRRRLLEAMGHHSAAVHADAERREAVANAREIAAVVADGSRSRRSAAVRNRGSSLAAWAAAVTALALLLTLAAVLFKTIGRGPARRAEVPAPPAAAVVAVADAAPAQPADVSPARPPARVEPPAPVAADGESAEPEPAAPAQPPQVAASPAAPAAAPASDAAPASPRVPQGDALAIAAPVAAASAAPPAMPRAEPPAAAAGTSLGVVGGDGVIVRRMEEGQPVWVALPGGAAIGAREDIVVPPGFQSDVNVRGVTIRLLPATRAVVAVEPSGVPRLEVVFGRAVARADRPDAVLGVAAGGLVGAITAGLAGPVAIGVDLEREPGSDPAADPARVRASVIAVTGGLVWRQGAARAADEGRLEGIAPEGMVDSRTALTWDSAAPAAARISRLHPLPEWVESPRPADRLARSAGEALRSRLDAQAPLARALEEMASDQRVENRTFAAATRALLGDFDAAVELLCVDSPTRGLKERQWLALEAETVPLALARGVNAAAKLRAAFEDRGPPGKAEEIFAMARGIGDEELAHGAAERLVDALEAPDLVVRRYAYKCLCDIVKPSHVDRLHYRPDAQPERRREGAAWWRGQLQKGLIRRPGAA